MVEFIKAYKGGWPNIHSVKVLVYQKSEKDGYNPMRCTNFVKRGHLLEKAGNRWSKKNSALLRKYGAQILSFLKYFSK